MTTPREHAELAARLRDLECSLFDKDENATLREAADLLDPPPDKRSITLTVNGKEWVLPELFRDEPEEGTTYWTDTPSGAAKYTWRGDIVDTTYFMRQRVHASRSDCQAWSEFERWCRGGGV